MQVTDLPPSVQVLRRVLVGSSTNQVPSCLSIRVRPKSVSCELASISVQSKLAAIIETIPTKSVPVISQGEIVNQLLFCRRKVRVSISIIRCAMVARPPLTKPDHRIAKKPQKSNLTLILN